MRRETQPTPAREKVTVRPSNHPDYPGGFRVRYPGPPDANGRPTRRNRYFTNSTDAETFAKECRKELGDVGEAFGSITEPERAAITFWRYFNATMPDTPPPALLSILQEFAERWKTTRASVTVQVAVDAYHAAKRAEGLRPVSLKSISTRCQRFAAVFGARPISSITSAELSDYLLGLPLARPRPGSKQQDQVGLRTKTNHRLTLSGLFNYAKGRGWVSSNPVTDAAKPRPPKTRPGILRPGDVARLFGALEKAAPALVPFYALRFFGGIREQEVLRMDWSNIDLRAKEINLPDPVTKTGRSRTVKIEPALAAFLSPYKQPDGAVVASADMVRRYHLAKALRILQDEDAAAVQAAKEKGKPAPRVFPVPMPANCARHSFASYHLLAFRHQGRTALELGHGENPELLLRFYKGTATAAEAKAFWAIRPTGKIKNVVPFEAAKPAVEWPPTAELQRLLWEKPAVEIARMLGVSDKAVEKHARRHGLTKPPRGYWATKKSAQ